MSLARWLRAGAPSPDTKDEKNCDSKLIDAVNNSRWWAVRDLIDGGVSEKCRAWAVEEASQRADNPFVVDILYTTAQRNSSDQCFPHLSGEVCGVLLVKSFVVV
ncbi:hypothetical protein BaRGS_00027009 [Batillaria attramentaria]|uniref:Uncharacterized protein n=1 Tax=Batillaria attramentaria TaxID=370345 RepID=A0ABD0K370_9CAEN